MVLTDDGVLANSMMHPRYQKIKLYEVTLNTALQPLHQQMIVDHGVQLDDGPSKFHLEKIDKAGNQWLVTMSEGRNRQIRRTFLALGYTVTKLHRTKFGEYALDELQSGQYKPIKIEKLQDN
jgi:23S rRNA pseudouridine2605 synthase